MKRIIKAGLMMLLGVAIWTNGGDLKHVSAEPGGDGICKAGWLVTYEGDFTYCVLPGGSCRYHPSGVLPACAQTQQRPTNTRPVPPKPSSYGAVAWDGKAGFYGSASKQVSKQAADELALRRCNSANCKIMMQYANQCTAVAYGLEKGGTYFWQFSSGLTSSKAERTATSKCSKAAKNCKILLSECSPAGEIDRTSQTQQYKGLGE